MHDASGMSQRNLFGIAILVDLVLFVALIAILGLAFGDDLTDQEPAVIETQMPTMSQVPTDPGMPTEIIARTPIIMSTPTPTPTESPTLTPIPSPTGILPEGPFQVPYVFLTPVFIPPNMRDPSVPTPTRTRTR